MKPLWLIFWDTAYLPIMYGHFAPSWRRWNVQDFDLVADRMDHAHGAFGEPRFLLSYREQMTSVIAEAAANPGRIIVWTDSDLRFYAPVLPEILSRVDWFDLTCSRDGTDFCTGFQFFRSTNRILEFFNYWLAIDARQSWPYAQISFQKAIADCRLNVCGLPPSFWNLGFVPMKYPWEPDKPLPDPPGELVVHHANYTKGIANKILLLDRIFQRHETLHRLAESQRPATG